MAAIDRRLSIVQDLSWEAGNPLQLGKKFHAFWSTRRCLKATCY